MSVETEVLEALAADTAVISLLGTNEKIMSGNPGKKLMLPYPLLLVDVVCGEPEIEGEEGILIDRWNCTIWLLIEGSITAIEEAVRAVMEKLGFKIATMNRINEDRPERTCTQMKFNGFRIRR